MFANSLVGVTTLRTQWLPCRAVNSNLSLARFRDGSRGKGRNPTEEANPPEVVAVVGGFVIAVASRVRGGIDSPHDQYALRVRLRQTELSPKGPAISSAIVC